MGDLISRKALIQALKTGKETCKGLHEYVFFDAIMAIVDNQPTAYNVDKVVEWLENNRQQVLYMADDSEYFLGQLTLLNRIIPLVKGAVKDESNTMQR